VTIRIRELSTDLVVQRAEDTAPERGLQGNSSPPDVSKLAERVHRLMKDEMTVAARRE